MAHTLLSSSNALQLRSSQDIAASSLLEFESPTAALLAMPIKPAARRILWVVVSLVAACVGASALFPVDMVVTASGRVVSLQPTIVVQPLETAIVREINVSEGQIVRAGQVLARLDSTFSAADAGALEAQVRSFQAEVDRLTAESSDLPYHPSTAEPNAAMQLSIYGQRQAQYRSQIESYSQKTKSLQAELMRAQADVKAFTERVKIAAELESKRMELERLKVGSQMNRLAAQDVRIEMERHLTDASGVVERAKRNLQQMIAEQDSFQQQWRAQVSQQLNERSRSLNDAKEGLRKATLRRELVDLRAEQDAVVLTVAKVSVGSVMQSGDQLISLVPSDAPLEVEAGIRGADAGHVQPGDTVAVKFDTYPFVQYGMAEGTVRTVSADSFTGGEETQRDSAMNPGRPAAMYYKVRVAITQINMHDVPGGFQLKPGMPLTTDIKVGRRTLLTYFFAQILPIGLEGMREP